MHVFLQAQMRRPGTYVALGAVLIAAAIVANALFLQPVRHPAPFFPREVAADPRPAADDPLVRAVQQGLARLDLYPGPVDGLAGPHTAAAIKAFETAARRTPTGVATPDLLAEIAAAAASRQPGGDVAIRAPEVTPIQVAETPAAAGAEDGRADPLVAAVQDALAVSAYGPLTADGVIGPETRAAIMRFQRDHGLPVTGEVTEGLVVELRAAGAMSEGG
jgi:peptidoglycan hydrolase-like protein with peptidoglycan-binding domain